MDMIKRILAGFLVAIGVVVALNLILTPLYHDGSPEYPLWRIVNWFMAVGVLIALVVNIWRRRALAGDASILEYVRTSVAYYGTIVLTMLFFWEWLWTLNPDSETGDAVTSHLIYFPIMDSLFVVIALATGGHLWKDEKGFRRHRIRFSARRQDSWVLRRLSPMLSDPRRSQLGHQCVGTTHGPLPHHIGSPFNMLLGANPNTWSSTMNSVPL